MRPLFKSQGTNMNWMAKLFSGGVKEIIHETGEAK
jgi:hypothetical protein